MDPKPSVTLTRETLEAARNLVDTPVLPVERGPYSISPWEGCEDGELLAIRDSSGVALMVIDQELLESIQSYAILHATNGKPV